MANLQHFYDGQIRRYITQIVRMMSGFSYEDSSGNIKSVPVMYGDITRQVGSILRDNSENKIPTAPRMALYIDGLELDTSRLSDASFVSKVNIREKKFDSNGNEYLNKEGKNYTVERLMPTPYTLSVNLDIWSTNTDQKLQILEQIFMIFNPSLELQTTDNYVDWTSLSIVRLENITWSSRTIPQGTESEIDVATLQFETPIYISPPAKVKRLGVITDIVARIHNESIDLYNATTDYDYTVGEGDAVTRSPVTTNKAGETISPQTIKTYDTNASVISILKTTYKNIDLLVLNGTAKLLYNSSESDLDWYKFLEAFPFKFQEGASILRLNRADIESEIVGSIAINPNNTKEVYINWDIDSLPTDTVITGPTGERSKIDYIIDPLKTNPLDVDLQPATRFLILESIGNSQNSDGADAWKNLDGSDFIAFRNDIIEWDGNNWHIVFNSATSTQGVVYTTNLNTGVQYKFENDEWILSFEGEYPNGTWWIDF